MMRIRTKENTALGRYLNNKGAMFQAQTIRSVASSHSPGDLDRSSDNPPQDAATPKIHSIEVNNSSPRRATTSQNDSHLARRRRVETPVCSAGKTSNLLSLHILFCRNAARHTSTLASTAIL